MSDTTRILMLVIALVLVVAFVAPLLFMSGMMASMMGGGVWLTATLLVFVLVAAGAVLAVGLQRR
jgi:hypothetical protein